MGGGAGVPCHPVSRRFFMKDKRGCYYYPFPANKRVRMYVRDQEGMIWFRMWNADDPKLWEDHGWVPYGAIQEAMQVYEGKGFNPAQAYDIQTAMATLKAHMNDPD
jgi:hypothetical protein